MIKYTVFCQESYLNKNKDTEKEGQNIMSQLTSVIFLISLFNAVLRKLKLSFARSNARQTENLVIEEIVDLSKTHSQDKLSPWPQI